MPGTILASHLLPHQDFQPAQQYQIDTSLFLTTTWVRQTYIITQWHPTVRSQKTPTAPSLRCSNQIHLPEQLTMNWRRHRTPTGIILWLDDEHNKELLAWEIFSLHRRMEDDRKSMRHKATPLQQARDQVLIATQAAENTGTQSASHLHSYGCLLCHRLINSIELHIMVQVIHWALKQTAKG